MIALKNLEIQWRWLRARIVRRRAQLALSLRITTAAILALVVAQLVHIPLPMWTVITAVILTQISVGRSLKATTDYFLGTVGGAVYGGLIAILIPHETELTLIIVFALAVAPLALFAALKQNMNVLPITAIIVLLMPTMSTTLHVTPFWSAVYRVMEVGLGGLIGLAVSFLVLPASAHRQVRQAAARALDLMARAAAPLLAGMSHGLSNDELHDLQDGIGISLVEINAVGAEAERERSAHLSREPSTGPLCRTLLRLRHDLVMVGRTAGGALTDPLHRRVSPKLDAVANAIHDYMQDCSRALLASAEPPSLAPLEQALQAYETEIDLVRREGLTRELPAETVEHFFAVGFVLEQMHKNLVDLQRVVAEWGPKLDEDDG
ncbi:MAG: FUSC family protein [Alphaproteobacteria bacterium]|nr:FUSC family protein [Alphaproteobacteria bacterium]